MKDNKNSYERNFILTRDLYGMNVEQRSKDGLFNASLLLQQWNKENSNSKKYLSDFFRLEETQIYLDEVCTIRLEEIQESLGNPNYLKINTRFKSTIDNQQLMEIDTTKSFKLNVGDENLEINIIDFKKGGKSSQGIKPDVCYMDGLLFSKLAFWLNPRFEARTVKWVSDELVNNRNLLADNNKEWKSMLAKLGATKENDGYKLPNKLKNYIIINDYYKNCRNHFSIEQMRECLSLEKEIIRLVDFKMIKNIDELINYLSKIYLHKYPNSVLPQLN